MKKQNTKLPAWFEGMQYDKGDTVKNIFSGEEYEPVSYTHLRAHET